MCKQAKQGEETKETGRPGDIKWTNVLRNLINSPPMPGNAVLE